MLESLGTQLQPLIAADSVLCQMPARPPQQTLALF
jgi:hypothetical protein